MKATQKYFHNIKTLMKAKKRNTSTVKKGGGIKYTFSDHYQK